MKTRDELSYNLGIDIGTSSVKAVLAAEDGSEFRVASAPCDLSHPLPGWAEADPEQWWRAVVQAVDSLETTGTHIRGIGISVLYPALLLFDRELRPLRKAVLYCDQRAAEESQQLLARYGREKAIDETGNAFPVGTSTITSLAWLRKHEPEIFQNTHKIGHANTFLVHKLTGQFCIDYSNASLTGIYDTGKNRWSDSICNFAKIPRNWLPEVLPGSVAAGALTPEAAGQLGLPAGIPVAAGAGDTVCSALGIGIRDTSELFVSCGSTNSFAALSAKPHFRNGLVNTCYLDDKTWLNIGASNAAGAAVEWFVKTYLKPGEYDRFFELCHAAQPGSGGVLFLPYLSGERTPYYNPHAKGVFFGLSMSTTLADTARSVLEGISLADRNILETFEQNGRRIHEIRAAGGGVKHHLKQRIMTDVTGRNIAFCSIDSISAFGAALLGGIASGTYADVHEAATVAREAGEFTHRQPNMSFHKTYEKPYQTFRALYDRIGDLF